MYFLYANLKNNPSQFNQHRHNGNNNDQKHSTGAPGKNELPWQLLYLEILSILLAGRLVSSCGAFEDLEAALRLGS